MNDFTVSDTLLGFPSNCQKGENLNYLKNIETLGGILVKRTMSGFRRFDFIYKFCEDYKEQTRALDSIKLVFNKIMDKYRERHENKVDQRRGSISDVDNKDKFIFLDWLIEQKQNGADFEVESEVNTFIFGVINRYFIYCNFYLFHLLHDLSVSSKYTRKYEASTVFNMQ